MAPRCFSFKNQSQTVRGYLLEITSGWSHDAKHIPGVQNVVADGISKWPNKKIARNLQTLTQGEWREQSIGKSGGEFLETILQPDFPTEYIDEIVWGAMTRNAES